MKIIYSPECAGYRAPCHPEAPRRVTASAELLQKNPRYQFLPAQPCSEEDLLRVHSRRLIDEIQRNNFYERETPTHPDLFKHAQLSAGAAIQAAELAWNGEPAFSLMRPPGHHASRDWLMGYCYFNNIAIAVARLLASPHGPQRVAIVDFDCHHGNGTESIFRGSSQVLFVSLHESPAYPWTGLKSQGNALNFPLPPNTDGPTYLKAFDGALESVRQFAPDLVAVSAGFDAYKRDPITEMGLEIETFGEIGRRLAELNRPLFAILEGGYSSQLPKCIAAFLDAVSSALTNMFEKALTPEQITEGQRLSREFKPVSGKP